MRTVILTSVLLISAVLLLTSCSSSKPPLKTVASFDLKKFMGDWYVIAHIPTPIEKGSSDHLEQYELAADGEVNIRFSVLPDGKSERKTYNARARIPDPADPAVWKVQFFRPLWFPYRVMYLDEKKGYSVIGLPNRSYLWIMAREKMIPEQDYSDILNLVEEQGYELDRILKVKQVWEGTDNAF